MPLVRDTSKPQHNLADFHYGELPLAALESGTETGQLLVWINSTQEWVRATLIGTNGITVNVNPLTGQIEIGLAEGVVASTFTADAYLVSTVAGSFTANAVLV